MTIGYGVVTLNWDGNGSPGTNTWNMRTTGSDFANAEEPEDLMGLVEDFYNGMKTILRTGLVIAWDGVYHGLGIDQGDTKQFTPWSITVGGQGDDAPEAIACVVQWGSASGGRRGKGRTFLGPLNKSMLNSVGQLDPTFTAPVQTAADALVSASSGFANGALGVYSRVDNLVRDFTTATKSAKYGLLRSRRD